MKTRLKVKPMKYSMFSLVLNNFINIKIQKEHFHPNESEHNFFVAV